VSSPFSPPPPGRGGAGEPSKRGDAPAKGSARFLRAEGLATSRVLCHDEASLMRWIVPTVNPDSVTRLERALKLGPLLARLLVLRGVEAPEGVEAFLRPRLSGLHDPFLMAGMKEAVERLARAIERHEKILIYGDYDVDGTMAAVVLLTALRAAGADVEVYIPHRLTDGYGMRVPVIEKAHAEGVRVVLSVDTGIREDQVIARAQELGIDCIVTDHHQPGGQLPPAFAVLNPKRPDCAYPDKNLAGVGVAFKLAQALHARCGPGLSERMVQSYLKIVAIGTIADVVPLVGENRVIVRHGLEGLGHGAHTGLHALLEVAGLCGRPASAGDVAFRLAPRLNAAGRMEDAREVIELFTSADLERARAIAEKLDGLNRQRQRAEEQILGEIVRATDREPSKWKDRYSLVFWGEGWHRGVIGIVAQRVVERFHRPTLVIGVEQGVGHGSGRSIARFNLLKALSRSSNLFERYGGHSQAAGFTLPVERIGELERRLEAFARAVLLPQDLEPVLRIDAEIGLKDVNEAFYQDLCGLRPFGLANPTPVFCARSLVVAEPPRILKEKHLKIRLFDGGRIFDALMWRGAGKWGRLARNQKVDAAFSVEENVYQGKTTLQLVLKDLREQGR
jgi:single-stranded-DNA-specific exonuclease